MDKSKSFYERCCCALFRIKEAQETAFPYVGIAAVFLFVSCAIGVILYISSINSDSGITILIPAFPSLLANICLTGCAATSGVILLIFTGWLALQEINALWEKLENMAEQGKQLLHR